MAVIPTEEDKKFLIDRNVPLREGAQVGRQEDGTYLVNNHAPLSADQLKAVDDAGFRIVRQWIIGGDPLTAEQWYVFEDLGGGDQ